MLPEWIFSVNILEQEITNETILGKLLFYNSRCIAFARKLKISFLSVLLYLLNNKAMIFHATEHREEMKKKEKHLTLLQF